MGEKNRQENLEENEPIKADIGANSKSLSEPKVISGSDLEELGEFLDDLTGAEFGNVDLEEEDYEEDDNDEFENTQGEIGLANEFSEEYGALLEKFGLVLDIKTFKHDDEDENMQEVMVNIASPERFLNALKSISEKELKKASSRESLRTLFGKFYSQICDFYDLSKGTDDVLNMARALPGMSEQYARFAKISKDNQLNRTAAELADLSSAVSEKYLREYVRISNLAVKNDFCIDNPNLDNTIKMAERLDPSEYEEKIGKILAVIEECSQNPNAAKLVARAANHLLKNLEKSRKNADKKRIIDLFLGRISNINNQMEAKQ